MLSEVLTVPITRTLFSVLITVLFAHSLQAQTDNEALGRDAIRFSGSQYYPPFEWLDDRDRPQGFIYDIQHAMAASQNMTASVQLLEWNAALSGVLNGEFDAVALIPSAERADRYDFTPPFHYVAHGIYSHQSGTQFGTLEQLEGHTLAVVNNAFAADEIAKLNLPISIVTTDNELACLKAVADAMADVCLEVIMTSNHLAAMHQVPVQLSSPPFWPQPYVFAVKKGNNAALDRLNTQLADIVINGTYIDIYNEWADQLTTEPQTLWDNVRNVAWVLAVLLGLITAISAWTLTLRKQVNKKTLQLRREIERVESLQSRITYQATHDYATNLLTQEAFFEELINYNTDDKDQLTVVATEIRNMTEGVSAFGYNAAVELLSAVTARLKNIDAGVAAHLGSGTFLLGCYRLNCVYELVNQLSHAHADNNFTLEPQLVFGAAVSDTPLNDHQSVQELVRRAVTALASANKKRVQLCIYNEQLEPDSTNVQLINDFQRYGCTHCVLFYQPQLNLASDSISHVEALIRWQHPTLGLLGPDRFIDLLEESGMINILTQWVIEQAVSMIKRNQFDSRDITISVNITTRDLAYESFIEFVKAQVADIGPGNLILEVTESDLIDDVSFATRSMIELDAMGIKCAVDDYGTGYSTLSYLNELAVDEVKLDRSFVSQIVSNERSRKIVRSTIALARDLGLIVVAEGVEDQETLELLQQMGCHRIQGYFISKPVTEEKILQML